MSGKARVTDSKAMVAELLGSFFLLFGGGLAILSSGGDLIVISFGFGLALLAALYAFAERSGGHFNPAVSLAMLLDKRIATNTFVGYVAAQFVGFVLAGLGLFIVSNQASVAQTATHRAAGSDLSFLGAYVIEVLLAAIFVTVIMRVTRSAFYGPGALLAISFTLVALNLAGAQQTGASVNPARSFGSAAVGNNWADVIIWLTAPMVGGVVGWLMYRAVHEGE